MAPHARLADSKNHVRPRLATGHCGGAQRVSLKLGARLHLRTGKDTRKDTVWTFQLAARRKAFGHGSTAEAHHLWLAPRLHGRMGCPRHLPSVLDQRSGNLIFSREAIERG